MNTNRIPLLERVARLFTPLGVSQDVDLPKSQPSLLGRLRGPIRLRTLTTLRWMAVGGQTLAILFVHFGLGFDVPLGICLGTIAASAWLNLFTIMRFSPQRYLSDGEAARYIGFDIIQLCALLFFTGGLQNPFAALILAPVTIAASVLPLRPTITIGGLALLALGLLAVLHMPLPWRPGENFAIPTIYIAGMWTALSFSVIFFAVYAHRIAAEAAQMRSALTATQIVLSREERLSALGGLAAAAAHELGTPLATIQLTAQEMVEELSGETGIDRDILQDDAALLISQARRCRDILGRLSSRGDEGDAMHDRIRLDSLLKEAAGPFVEDGEGPEIIFDVHMDGAMSTIPSIPRRPEIIYGLRNFIENAARFAKEEVKIAASWHDETLSITITDDGPGFSPEILARLGEPYVNPKLQPQRNRLHSNPAEAIIELDELKSQKEYVGMGLGFFIAKTLLEHTGARIHFDNVQEKQASLQAGAYVRSVWPISVFMTEKEQNTVSNS